MKNNSKLKEKLLKKLHSCYEDHKFELHEEDDTSFDIVMDNVEIGIGLRLIDEELNEQSVNMIVNQLVMGLRDYFKGKFNIDYSLEELSKRYNKE